MVTVEYKIEVPEGYEIQLDREHLEPLHKELRNNGIPVVSYSAKSDYLTKDITRHSPDLCFRGDGLEIYVTHLENSMGEHYIEGKSVIDDSLDITNQDIAELVKDFATHKIIDKKLEGTRAPPGSPCPGY